LALEALEHVGVEQPDRATLPAAWRLSDPDRLAALLVAAGFRDVEVRELEHEHPVPDPEALFRSIPTWSAPLRPLFERLSPQQWAEGAAAFGRLVDREAGPDGLPMRALVAIGTR
jgi:hypothetical protein